MHDPPLHLPRAHIAVERRGRTAALAKAALALSLPAFLGAGAVVIHATTSADLALLILFGAMPVCLASAAHLVGARFDPAVSAPRRARLLRSLTIDGQGLRVRGTDGARAYARGAVADGWIEDLGDPCTAVLRMKNGDVLSIEVAELEQGWAVLRAAGVAAEQRVLRMRLANATTQLWGGGCLAGAASVILTLFFVRELFAAMVTRSSPISAAWLAVDVAAFLVLVRALTPARAVVGTDGVTLERVLGRRFIPFLQIADVLRDRGAVILKLEDGKTVRLPTGARHGGWQALSAMSPQAALFQRIVEASAAGKRGSSQAARVGELDRSGRPLAAWRDHLRRLTQSEALYRRLAVSREEIAVVLEDAGAPAERRVAAALSLAAIDDPSMKRRVHDAVAACADPRLRIALAAAAEDALSEEELRGLAEIAASAAPPRQMVNQVVK